MSDIPPLSRVCEMLFSMNESSQRVRVELSGRVLAGGLGFNPPHCWKRKRGKEERRKGFRKDRLAFCRHLFSYTLPPLGLKRTKEWQMPKLLLLLCLKHWRRCYLGPQCNSSCWKSQGRRPRRHLVTCHSMPVCAQPTFSFWGWHHSRWVFPSQLILDNPSQICLASWMDNLYSIKMTVLTTRWPVPLYATNFLCQIFRKECMEAGLQLYPTWS